MQPTTIELFAGIAGFSSPHTHPLALVEKEPSCRAIIRRHHPGTLILDDVRVCGAHNLPHANIIKFGFPCQDLSVAGNRAGLSGARSGLFYEATRIVNELQPDFALWENVPGLLSSRDGRDFLSVLIELDRIGYFGCRTMLDAQFFGVAQRRQRVFGLFARRDIGAERCAEILSLATRLPWNTQTRRKARARVAAAVAASAGHHGRSSPRGDGSDNLIAFDWHRTNANVSEGDTPSLTVSDSHAPAIALSNRGLDTGDIFETMRAGSHGALPMVAAAPRAAATYDRGDGVDNLIVGADRVRNTISAHHGRNSGEDTFVPSVGETLGTESYSPTKSSSGQMIDFTIGSPFGVRRLTPRECERLQGFEDDYTAWGIDEGGNRVEMSDSVRYRMLGNAVCQNVAAWIDNQIVRYGYGE